VFIRRKSLEEFLANVSTNGEIMKRLSEHIKIEESRLTPEIEKVMEKLSLGKPLDQEDIWLLDKALASDPELLEDLLIAVFLTYTTFESLLSARIGKTIRYETAKNHFPHDQHLRHVTIDIISNWAANNPIKSRIKLSKEMISLLRIQRALRRSSEKMGEVVERIVYEKLRAAGIPAEGFDKHVLNIEKPVDICIPSCSDPKIIIEVKFHNSHGTKLPRDADEIESLKSDVEKLRLSGKHILLVVVIDGAGWFFRKNALRRILNTADAVFQLKELDELVKFIKDYLKSPQQK